MSCVLVIVFKTFSNKQLKMTRLTLLKIAKPVSQSGQANFQFIYLSVVKSTNLDTKSILKF